MVKYLLGIVFLLSSFQASFGGGIKGVIKDEQGNPLPYATIYVKQLATGTTSNADGYYEISLSPGNYSVTFQYIGYEPQNKQVSVDDKFKTINVSLETQTMVLQDVQIFAGKEDPAYTIMRKAIAKAKYHTQQIDRYTAEVYIKGTGQLKNAPFFLRKTLEKEGVTEDRVFISESVSEVEYIRPNTYNEKVISVYTTGEENDNVSPNGYVYGSFYEPELAKSVSPLSPKAFSYYKFEYDGTFREGNYEVSKIKVIPRSRGDNVFSGTIHIVEDYWSIYSLDLTTVKLGIQFDIKQIYKPVQDKAWLPVTHEFEVTGKVFGFEFEGKYLATVSDYEIELNPDLNVQLEVIDEKVEKELAKEIEDQFDKEEDQEALEMLNSGKEVTRKQLRKLVKAYEKAERKEQDEPEVISNRSYRVDSLAYKRDSAYWSKIRPVPLSKLEKKGYDIEDSLAVKQREEREGDTTNVKKDRKGFQLWHVLLGGRYKVGKKAYFEIHTPNGLYNTVDGFDINYELSFSKTFDNEHNNWLRFGPTARYTFAREAFNGEFEVRYGFGPRRKRNNIQIKAGRNIKQFNDDEPIHPIVNTLATLMLERNYMKIYERDFVDFTYKKDLNDKIDFSLNFSAEKRRQLFNNTTYRFWDVEGQGFTPNAPTNFTLNDTSFPEHNAFLANFKLTYIPIVKYRIYNGRKSAITDDSPTLTLNYTQGIPDIIDSKVDFNLLEAGIAYDFNIGVRGLVDLRLNAGKFLNSDSLFFMDYKHFLGNRTPLVTTDPVASFRLLDYYNFSTSDQYVTANLQYQFRKFLVTQIPFVRLMGVREGFFVNYLANNEVKPYTEVGYGINYIFRILRVEAVTSFFEGKYQDWGIRIGVATNLDDIF